MLISRMLYGIALLLAVRDLDDTIKIDILALGSIQLIAILLEFNFVNNSLKVLASNTTSDPQRYLTFLLIPIASITVFFTFFYATFIFGFKDVSILIGCSCFIALQQLTKVPDVSIKLKGFLKSTYIIETFSTFLQILLVISLAYLGLLSARNVLIVMILAQVLQLVVKACIKRSIGYSNKYKYTKKLTTLYNFYEPSVKFATTTISTTLFVSLIIPLIAVSLSAPRGYFLLLSFRILSYCDQLSWSPFYARLPMIHQDFRNYQKTSMTQYSYAAKKVLLLFTLLSLGAISMLLVPSVQLFFDYQFSVIVIPLVAIMWLNRAVAMNMQLLFATKNIEIPCTHITLTLMNLLIFVIQPQYLLLCTMIFFVSLVSLHIRNQSQIKRD